METREKGIIKLVSLYAPEDKEFRERLFRFLHKHNLDFVHSPEK